MARRIKVGRKPEGENYKPIDEELVSKVLDEKLASLFIASTHNDVEELKRIVYGLYVILYDLKSTMDIANSSSGSVKRTLDEMIANLSNSLDTVKEMVESSEILEGVGKEEGEDLSDYLVPPGEDEEESEDSGAADVIDSDREEVEPPTTEHVDPLSSSASRLLVEYAQRRNRYGRRRRG